MTAPPEILRPLRRAVATRPRGSLVRNVSLMALRALAPRFRVSELAEVRPLDMPNLAFEAVDSMVADAIYWFGMRGYEGPMHKIWPALCRQSRSTLEIGGNIGFYSVLGGAAAGGTYVAVEPIPEIAATLRRNLSRNAVSQVEVIEAAVVPGDGEGTVVLNIPDADRAAPVGAHLLHGSEISRPAGRAVSVRGLGFRTLSEGRDLIKIDAEGIEEALLADAMEILDHHKPSLALEVLPDTPRLGRLVTKIAERWGYRIVIVPEYGREDVIVCSPSNFSTDDMPRHNAKDIVILPDPAVITAAIS